MLVVEILACRAAIHITAESKFFSLLPLGEGLGMRA
jgi:hypothetical protein